MDDKELQVPENKSVVEECKELGIMFGCEDGVCGTCMVEVDEGMENLTPRNEAEKNMGLEGNQRLMCQCKLKGGTVKVKY